MAGEPKKRGRGRPAGKGPKGGDVVFSLPRGHYDYLRRVVHKKKRLGRSANDAARHILIRELDAMENADLARWALKTANAISRTRSVAARLLPSGSCSAWKLSASKLSTLRTNRLDMKKRRARLTVAKTLREVGSGWALAKRNAQFLGNDFCLFHGDARNALPRIQGGLVNTCVTSPPYWRARDYMRGDQIGQEENAQEFIDAIVSVMREVRRLLREDGTAWLNLGDTYLNGVGPEQGRPPARGWKRNKQLSLMPFRVAIALQEEGWWVRNVGVWQKSNAMPESVDDRLSSAWEPIFYS